MTPLEDALKDALTDLRWYRWYAPGWETWELHQRAVLALHPDVWLTTP